MERPGSLAPGGGGGGEFLRFTHEAMATYFEILIPKTVVATLGGGSGTSRRGGYAEQAAREAFAELDRLEAELSRFREDSDIVRLAALRSGESLILGVASFECLRLAREIHAATHGAFDVTVGRLLSCWRDKRGRRRTPSPEELAQARAHCGQELLELLGNTHAARVKRTGVQVDLGGIGKGYALDKMAELLRVWGLDEVLLHAGQSTVLVCRAGVPSGGVAAVWAASSEAAVKTSDGLAAGWPILVRDPLSGRRGRGGRNALGVVRLASGAISGSGRLLHGPHILDPRTGRPAARLAAWAVAPTAGDADALSTAFMVMSAAQVAVFCRRRPEVSALLAVEGGAGAEVRGFGRLKR